MPQILDRLVNQLTSKGMPKQKAWATAIKVLTKSGNLDEDQDLTEKGKKRQAMGEHGRAQDRAAKRSKGHDAPEFKYNSAINLATLKMRKLNNKGFI